MLTIFSEQALTYTHNFIIIIRIEEKQICFLQHDATIYLNINLNEIIMFTPFCPGADSHNFSQRRVFR